MINTVGNSEPYCVSVSHYFLRFSLVDVCHGGCRGCVYGLTVLTPFLTYQGWPSFIDWCLVCWRVVRATLSEEVILQLLLFAFGDQEWPGVSQLVPGPVVK